MVLGVVLCSTVLCRLQQCSTICAMLYNYIHFCAVYTVLYCVDLFIVVQCYVLVSSFVEYCQCHALVNNARQFQGLVAIGFSN